MYREEPLTNNMFFFCSLCDAVVGAFDVDGAQKQMPISMNEMPFVDISIFVWKKIPFQISPIQTAQRLCN